MALAEAAKRLDVPVVPLRADRADLVKTILRETALMLTSSDEAFRRQVEKVETAIADFRKHR